MSFENIKMASTDPSSAAEIGNLPNLDHLKIDQLHFRLRRAGIPITPEIRKLEIQAILSLSIIGFFHENKGAAPGILAKVMDWIELSAKDLEKTLTGASMEAEGNSCS